MAVNLSLSPEQAALLVPLLQQLGSSPPIDVSPDRVPHCRNKSLPTESIRNTQSFLAWSTSPCSSSQLATSGSEFTADELLTKKKKNKKCTSA